MSSHRPTLPPELVREVVQYIEASQDLFRLVALSEVWRREVERSLYSSVVLMKWSPKKQQLTPAHLLTLCPRVGPIVTSLDAGTIHKTCKNLIQILGSLPNLRRLRMEFRSGYLGLKLSRFIPEAVPFSLRSFTTNHNGSKELLDFLKTQQDIEELDLTYSSIDYSSFPRPEPEEFHRLRILKSADLNTTLRILRGQKIIHLSYLGLYSTLSWSAFAGNIFPTITSLAVRSRGSLDGLAPSFPNVTHITVYLASLPTSHLMAQSDLT